MKEVGLHPGRHAEIVQQITPHVPDCPRGMGISYQIGKDARTFPQLPAQTLSPTTTQTTTFSGDSVPSASHHYHMRYQEHRRSWMYMLSQMQACLWELKLSSGTGGEHGHSNCYHAGHSSTFMTLCSTLYTLFTILFAFLSLSRPSNHTIMDSHRS